MFVRRAGSASGESDLPAIMSDEWTRLPAVLAPSDGG